MLNGKIWFCATLHENIPKEETPAPIWNLCPRWRNNPLCFESNQLIHFVFNHFQFERFFYIIIIIFSFCASIWTLSLWKSEPAIRIEWQLKQQSWCWSVFVLQLAKIFFPPTLYIPRTLNDIASTRINEFVIVFTSRTRFLRRCTNAPLEKSQALALCSSNHASLMKVEHEMSDVTCIASQKWTSIVSGNIPSLFSSDCPTHPSSFGGCRSAFHLP